MVKASRSCSPKLLSNPRLRTSGLLYIFTAARLFWAQKWKNEETPTMEELLKKVLDIAELDTLSEALREQPRDFVKQSWKLIHIWAQKKTGT